MNPKNKMVDDKCKTEPNQTEPNRAKPCTVQRNTQNSGLQGQKSKSKSKPENEWKSFVGYIIHL